MIDITRIISAKDIIGDTVLNQVKDGAQSKDLTDAFACGQFLKVPSTQQRGFHGTAAAIRVLAGYESKFNDQLRKLLIYIEYANEFEKETSDGLERDLNNIIKCAEILYSLSYIQSGTAKTENLKDKLSKKLYDSRKDDGGWAYFTDISDEDSDMYFTASVYLALRSHYYNDLQNTRIYLIEKLKKYKSENIPDPTTFSKLCYIVYVFVKLKEHKDKETKKLLIEVFKKLWKSEHCVINSDFEQNIEYPCKQRHYYVRIPWQLYILSIANSLFPRYFAQKQSIERLNKIINSIIDGDGFIYKQSGKNISTRTYSILFEVLSNIEDTFKLNFRFRFFNILDWISSFFDSKIFKNFVSAIGLLLIALIVYKSVNNGTLNVDTIAPSIIATLLMISIQISKTK